MRTRRRAAATAARPDGGDGARAPGRRHRVALACVALVLLAVGLAGVVPGPAPAGAQPEVLKPEEVLTAKYTAGGKQEGDIDLPKCGSINIDGRGGMGAEWRVTSELGPGSVIYPGREWKVNVWMLTTAPVFLTGNDGPDPMHVRMVPDGPVEPGADPVTGPMNHFAHLNINTYVGPIGTPAQWGPWGADYDQNSTPNIFVGNDGNSVDVTITLRATKAGIVRLPQLSVSGYDATPIAGKFSCAMPIGWEWQVVAPPPPTAGADVAATDARLTDVVAGDAQSGVHAVLVDVLANDDDPNVPGGPGDLNQVRIADWQTQSVAGGVVECGTGGQKGLGPGTPLDQLSAGPCRYRPPFDFTGVDSFTYTVRSATGLQSVGKVSVTVVPNHRPTMTPAVLGTAVNTDEVFDLAPFTGDLDGDPLTCLAVGTPQPAVGTATVSPDCTLTWDNTTPAFTGNVTQTVRVCDDHPTLQVPDLGPGVVRAGDYSDGGDLSATVGRRCVEQDVVIGILAGLILPPTAATDADVVDAGYAADAVGAYTVRIPVLDNDTDGNGPKPAVPGVVLQLLTTPSPTQGTASVEGDEVVFTPADGYSGPVELLYRVCEDPLAQDPPYVDDPNTPLIDEGLPFCGAGSVNIEVLGNQPPVATTDEAVVAHDAEVVDLDLAVNDIDPEGEGLVCTAGVPTVSDPAVVAAASVTSDCLLDLTPVPGSDGMVEVAYEICDGHTLTDPAYPAAPYGADGRSPGDGAPRCSTGTAVITIVGPAPGYVEPADPGPACADDEAQTTVGVAVEADVVANDTDVDSQAQASPVILTGPTTDEPVTTEGGGSAAMTTLEGPGAKLAYQPAAGFTGTDVVAYTARDTAGNGCQAVLRITVTAAAEPGSGDATTTGDPSGSTGGDATASGSANGSANGSGTTVTGSLPATGNGWTLPLAGLGALLLLAGAGSVAMGNRRS